MLWSEVKVRFQANLVFGPRLCKEMDVADLFALHAVSPGDGLVSVTVGLSRW